LTRAVLYVLAAQRKLDQRCAFALNVARQQLMHMPLAAFKALVRDQFFILQLEPERAIEVLPSLVADTDARKALLEQVRAIASAGDKLTTAEDERLARLSQVLARPIETTTVPAVADRPARAKAPAKTDAALH